MSFFRSSLLCAFCFCLLFSVRSQTTPCNPVTSFYENFESSTNNALPACFKRVGSSGTITVANSPVPNAGPKALFIRSTSTNSQAVVALPPVSNTGTSTHQLRFKTVGNYPAGDTLQIGYLTNIDDSSTFVVLSQVVPPSILTYTQFIVYPGTAPGSNQYLAFRSKGTNGVSIDDVYWEPLSVF